MHPQIKLFIEHCSWPAMSTFIQINKWKEVVWCFFNAWPIAEEACCVFMSLIVSLFIHREIRENKVSV